MTVGVMLVKNSGYIFGTRNVLYRPQYGTLGHTAGDRNDSRLLEISRRRTSGYARSDRNETMSVRVRQRGTVVVGQRAEHHDPPCPM